MRTRILTVGHSNRPLTAFLDLLSAHVVELVIDVRRVPMSRRNPHFARGPLAAALAGARVGCLWLPALGGRRSRVEGSPHVGWREPAFAGYADHMDSAEFAEGARRLLNEAARATCAVMCAEARPEECHRRLLADWLCANGVDVIHIGDGEPRPHEVTPFARFVDGRVVYDRGQGRLF